MFLFALSISLGCGARWVENMFGLLVGGPTFVHEQFAPHVEQHNRCPAPPTLHHQHPERTWTGGRAQWETIAR